MFGVGAGGLRWPGKLQTRAGTLEFIVSGSGTPTLVLISGAGVTLKSWRGLYPDIEQIATVFAWNRFGAGGSDRPRTAQTGAAVVASLRELLRYAGLAPPYVLVAHSLGGLHANLFARLYPQEVAAMVLLEASHPRDRELLRGHENQIAGVLSRLFAMPQKIFRSNLHAEIEGVDESARQVAAAGPFPDIPLTVVTGGQRPPAWLMPARALTLRRAHQQELARLSPRGEQVIAQRSGHFPQLTEPALVLGLLRSAVQAAAPALAGVPQASASSRA